MKIKECFTSRWGDEGVLIEADWSQLECIGWAFLTKDPMMYKLLREGTDIHRMIGSMAHECSPEEITTEMRKKIKPATFLFIYGGSAYQLHMTHGIELEFAEKLYESFWTLFPVAWEWQNQICKRVEQTKRLIPEHTPTGRQKHVGEYKNITGRKFFFKTRDGNQRDLEEGNQTKFHRPEMVNYPVQSFCTADMHIIAMGHLFREAMEHRDEFLLINTVHDSIVIDCKKEYVNKTCKLVKNALEYVIILLMNKFGIEIDLPLHVELKVGPNWGKMEEIKVELLKED